MGLLSGLKKLVKPVLGAVGTAVGGPVGGMLGKAVGGMVAGSGNKKTANNYAQQAQWQNTPITMPGLSLSYDANGNPVGQATNPMNQQVSQGLMGTGGNLLNQYSQLASQGLFNGMPGLQQQFGQTNQDLGSYQTNTPGIMSQLQGIQGGLTGMQGYGDAASGILGQLGSFDPNQLAQSYTNNLRATAQPGEQNAAQDMAQSLFNTGRLGSTGGATQMGQLAQAQSQADLQRQLAGQQYAGQEQSRLAGLAGQMTGNQMGLAGAMSGLLGQQSGLSQQEYQNTNNTTTQRFQNAMNLFGAGNQQNQTQLSQQNGLLQGALGSIGAGNQIGQQDIQNLMQMLGAGATVSNARSGTQAQAYAPQMQAGVANNNMLGSALSGIFGNIFGGNSQANNLDPYQITGAAANGGYRP